MNFVRGIIGFFLAVFLAGFAVLNRHDVSVVISPAHEALDLPLYLIALGLMAIGFVIGGVFVWMNGASGRRVRRQQRKTIKGLEKELQNIDKDDVSATSSPPSEFFPALPKRG